MRDRVFSEEEVQKIIKRAAGLDIQHIKVASQVVSKKKDRLSY